MNETKQPKHAREATSALLLMMDETELPPSLRPVRGTPLTSRDLKYINACLNACAGIKDPGKLREQRDKLAEALEGLQPKLEGLNQFLLHQKPEFKSYILEMAIANIRAALANADRNPHA